MHIYLTLSRAIYCNLNEISEKFLNEELAGRLQPVDRLLGNPESTSTYAREIFPMNFALARMKFALATDRTLGEVITTDLSTSNATRCFSLLYDFHEVSKCQSED